MIKRILLYGLIACSIIVIFLLSASTNYLKKPFSSDDDVQTHLSNLNSMVDRGDWSKAELELKYLESAWNNVRKRIQFTGEADDIKRINETLYKLNSMMKIKDYNQIKEELAIIEFGWHDIGN